MLSSCAAALKAMEKTLGVPFSQDKLATGSTLLQVEGLQVHFLSNAQQCSEVESMLQMVYATMEQQLADMPLEDAEARAEAAEEEALLQASTGSVLSAASTLQLRLQLDGVTGQEVFHTLQCSEYEQPGCNAESRCCHHNHHQMVVVGTTRKAAFGRSLFQDASGYADACRVAITTFQTS